jgi:hypothetical protein
VLDVHIGPLSEHEHDIAGALRFHTSRGPVHDLYLVCEYEASEPRTAGISSPDRRLPESHWR